MAQTDHIKLDLEADTRWAKYVIHVLCPAVRLGILSTEHMSAIAMKLVRIKVTEA